MVYDSITLNQHQSLSQPCCDSEHLRKILRQDEGQSLLRLDWPMFLLGDDGVFHRSLSLIEFTSNYCFVDFIEDVESDHLGSGGVLVKGFNDLAV